MLEQVLVVVAAVVAAAVVQHTTCIWPVLSLLLLLWHRLRHIIMGHIGILVGCWLVVVIRGPVVFFRKMVKSKELMLR